MSNQTNLRAACVSMAIQAHSLPGWAGADIFVTARQIHEWIVSNGDDERASPPNDDDPTDG